MTVTVEKNGPVTTVIHARSEARNAMDPESANALTEAFLAFDGDPDAAVAVFWGAGGAFCGGWDLKYAASLVDQARPLAHLDFPEGNGSAPRGPLGPSRLELTKPVIAAVAGPAVVEAVSIPVIGGFGGGPWLDGRVRLAQTALGSNAKWLDSGADTYVNTAKMALEAFAALVVDVRAGRQIKG